MEGATYAQKTFGEVSVDLENFENKPIQAQEATTSQSTQETNTETQTQQQGATQEGAVIETVVEEKPNDVSDFEIPANLISQKSQVNTQQQQNAATSINIMDEIKKLPKAEILKAIGVNEFAIEIDEHLSKGGQAVDYLNARSIDFNKVSDESLIKESLRKQYPTATPSQIDLVFNRKYNVSEDATDEDKEFVDLQLKGDAYAIRQAKISEQQKFKIPETPILQKDEAYEQWKQAQESHPQLMEQLSSFYANHEATQNLTESKRVAINLGEGVPPFNFAISNPEVITRFLTDDGTIYRQLTSTQSGEPDVQKQQLIALFSLNPTKFLQDIFTYGKAMGVRKELVEEGQNAQRPQARVLPVDANTKATYGVGKFADKARS